MVVKITPHITVRLKSSTITKLCIFFIECRDPDCDNRTLVFSAPRPTFVPSNQMLMAQERGTVKLSESNVDSTTPSSVSGFRNDEQDISDAVFPSDGNYFNILLAYLILID